MHYLRDYHAQISLPIFTDFYLVKIQARISLPKRVNLCSVSSVINFVYLEPDPQHLCDMNPASLEMHNYWCYNEFQCLQWMSFDTPIFVLDLE